MKKDSQNTDPDRLLRYRDSIYAADLLVCAVACLDFFTFLSEGPKTFEEICDKMEIQPRPADVMVSLLLSMELIETNAHRYGLAELSAKYLVSASPDSLVPYYRSLKNRPQCLEFHDVLKTGRPAGWSSKDKGESWTKSMENPEFADTFTAAMDSRGAFLARKLAETIDASQHNALLDIAGGSGIYACTIANRNPRLAAAVLEIPPVDLAAKRSIESKGMSARVNVVAGNMFDEIPTGYDVHLFANAFHDWDIDAVNTLAANSFKSLSPGGFIAVFDAHLNQFKTGPLSVAEYSCLLMHSTEGKCYSTKEIGDILMSAGFGRVEVTDVAADRTLITGKKL
ncbi:MAG: methyltransferase [Thermodesulfobacteriota bacterium]|nr:methyltransferase [Thermodesulfobacteriota bacterium]